MVNGLASEKRLSLLGLLVTLPHENRACVLAAMVLLNVLAPDKRRCVLACLVNGCSVRATEEIARVHRDTVVNFGRVLGAGCLRLHNALVQKLSCSFIEVDEQHSFVFVKQGHLGPDHTSEMGDTWSWVAIDRKSRLAISFYVGKRSEQSAVAFVGDLRARLVAMPQITSDGLSLYAPAIARVFGPGIDFATTVKAWNTSRRRPRGAAVTDPGSLLVKNAVLGEPNLDMATTAHEERLNLTMRMANARLHRRTLAFSKTLASHEAAAALSYAHYNLCHKVRTLKTTPAVCAGIVDHPWTLEEFMEAILGAAPCELPETVPLRVRTPEEKKPIARAPAPSRKKREPDAQLNLFAWRPLKP